MMFVTCMRDAEIIDQNKTWVYKKLHQQFSVTVNNVNLFIEKKL